MSQVLEVSGPCGLIDVRIGPVGPGREDTCARIEVALAGISLAIDAFFNE